MFPINSFHQIHQLIQISNNFGISAQIMNISGHKISTDFVTYFVSNLIYELGTILDKKMSTHGEKHHNMFNVVPGNFLQNSFHPL